MSLQSELCLRASHLGESTLLSLMGYRKPSMQAKKRLLSVLSDPYLGLRSSAFDLRYSNREFAEKLAEVLGVGEETTQKELKKICAEIEEEEGRFTPVIWVDTGFKRTSQPIFALALMEHLRYLPFNDEELSEYHQASMIKRLELVGEKIRAHFRRSNGEIELWGTIQRYRFHFSECEALIILPDGTVHGEAANIFSEKSASLRLKGKKLTLENN